MSVRRTPPNLFQAGFTTVAAASASAFATIHPSTASIVRIREVGLFVNAATATSVEMVLCTTASASTSVLGQALDQSTSSTSIGTVDTAWSIAPAIGSNVPYNKITIPATIGSGVIWQWNEGEELIVPAGMYLALWNYGAASGSVLNAYIKWSE